MINLDEIDSFLSNLNSAKNDDELRALFQTYKAKFDLNVHPDPFSDEYKAKQLSIYEALAGKKYNFTNEVSEFDIDQAVKSPFPFFDQSCETVGNQMMAWGFLIKSLKLKPGSKIIEFGPGWGNTSIALAKMGFNITVVDVENNFCELISRRAQIESLNIKIVNSDFTYINRVNDKFDCILFFECFHHSDKHEELIRDCEKALLENGIIYFGAEPISDDFPLPWGLRMDGESLWAIRKMDG